MLCGQNENLFWAKHPYEVAIKAKYWSALEGSKLGVAMYVLCSTTSQAQFTKLLFIGQHCF